MTGRQLLALPPFPLSGDLMLYLSAASSDSIRPLLSASVQAQLSVPPTSFQLTYDLGLAALCADFQENVDFQFSLGWTALVTRFIGAANAKRALSGTDPSLQVIGHTSLLLRCLSRLTLIKSSFSPIGQGHHQGPGGCLHSHRSGLSNIPGVHDCAGNRRGGMYTRSGK